MQQVYHSDEVYRHHDGIRDPMGWARFSSGKFLVGALLATLVIVIVGGSRTGPNPVRDGIDTAMHVGGTAVALVRSLEAEPSR